MKLLSEVVQKSNRVICAAYERVICETRPPHPWQTATGEFFLLTCLQRFEFLAFSLHFEKLQTCVSV